MEICSHTTDFLRPPELLKPLPKHPLRTVTSSHPSSLLHLIPPKTRALDKPRPISAPRRPYRSGETSCMDSDSIRLMALKKPSLGRGKAKADRTGDRRTNASRESEAEGRTIACGVLFRRFRTHASSPNEQHTPHETAGLGLSYGKVSN